MSNEKSILVVDDNGINRLLPGLILRPFGWCVHECANGLDAIYAIRKIAVSCVLLDISMPDISGLDVLSELKKEQESINIKIIAYTAYAKPEEVQNLKKLGFDAVLLKPLTSKKLLEIINSN